VTQLGLTEAWRELPESELQTRARLIVCSKSGWEPPIRREHEFARLAARHGHPVRFCERPLDVRSLVSPRARGRWLTPNRRVVEPRLSVKTLRTVVPGHRGRGWGALERSLLARQYRTEDDGRAKAAVAMLPWFWDAIPAGARRVFDCTDDWSSLFPRSRKRIREMFRRIAAEADEVIVVSEALGDLFEGRRVCVVPNGVSDVLLDPLEAPRPGAKRLAYSGTLSERFDTQLIAEALRRLPEWTLDIYGTPQYAGGGDAPSPDLRALLDEFPGRARWHGHAARGNLAAVLDSARVLVSPHRHLYPGDGDSGQAWRGDSMKLYDYFARGRPAVVTYTEGHTLDPPPHLYVASDVDAFVAAILAADREPDSCADERRRWAIRQSWPSRWGIWSAAVFGVGSEP
jgi:glycosyltransferase involved in cell wall biosynthesis